MYAFPEFFGRTAVSWPLTPSYASGSPTATFVGGAAQNAGMHENDRLVAVNGAPFTGLKVFGDTIAEAKPGDTLNVTFRSPNSPERTASILLAPHRLFPSIAGIALIVFLKVGIPVFCILLGFWVAAMRPRDAAAWLLIPVTFGLCTIYAAGVESWGPIARVLGQTFRIAMSSFWPLSMLLFGYYFPEGFKYRPPAWVRAAMRILVPVLLVQVVVEVIDRVGQVENYRAVARLDAVLDRFGPVSYAISFVAVSGFFLFMRVKPYATASLDVRRRFNLIYTGATVGMFPLLILGVVQLVKHGELERIFPLWVVLGSLAMLMIFPVTLAYVIVVQRAMDVRMVIHQGLQYALARRGTFVIQIILNATVVAIAAVELQRRHNVLQSMAILGVGFAAILWLRKIADRARAWIDRRFFRDAYNAEQILSGLSDEVRSIVETRPLLERVTQRISESLHVPCVAVLTEHGGWYRPAYAIGYPQPPYAELAESGPVIRHLTDEAEPARVRLDDQDSWANAPGMPAGERRSLDALAPQLLLPLTVKQKLLGIISLGEKKSEAPYSGSDLRLLKSVATQTGLALANAQLTATIVEEVGRREKMTREIEIAREVQERLFPQRFPAVEGADYCGRCRTALGVGGDYYDFLSLPDGKFGIALGDISGKGIPAALMMASLQASLRAEASRADNDIAGLMARVNQALYEASSEDRYATFFYGQYDPKTQMLTYVNGGHCAPMLFRAASGGRTIERLDVGGPVVGLIAECAFDQAEIKLERASVNIEKGDRLVIFTDGISEAMNRDLEEWGEERLVAAIRATLDASASDSITRIMNAADEFAAGAPQHDDMTLVIFQLRSDEQAVRQG